MFYRLIHNVLAFRYYGYGFFNFLDTTYSMRISFGMMMAYITVLSAGALLCLYSLMGDAGKFSKYAICFVGGAIVLILTHIYVIHNAHIWWMPIDPAEHIAAAMRNASAAAVLSSLAVWLSLEKLVPWIRGQYWSAVVDMDPNEPIPWNLGP